MMLPISLMISSMMILKIDAQEQVMDDIEDRQLEAVIAEEIEDEFDEFAEDMNEEPGITVSIPFTSTLVKIMDLREWLKSPWTAD